MFSLVTKYQCASITSRRSHFEHKPTILQLIKVAKIPVILSKNFAGPCKGSATTPKCTSGGTTKTQIQFKPYVRPPYMGHDHKNMKLKRPMSPHLLIYAPTLPAMTSIAQRITGTITTFYALLLSGGALFLSNGIDSYVSAIQSLDLSRFSILIIKIILGAPFAFHYLNAIRFIAFNSGRWFMLKDVYSTAHKAMIGSVIMTIIFALL